MKSTAPAPFGIKAFRSIERASSGLRVTPLARAALENGVSFEDVRAYCASKRITDPNLPAAWYEACNAPPATELTPRLAAHITEMITDTRLEGALARSVLAEGTIEHARLWWRGVL